MKKAGRECISRANRINRIHFESCEVLKSSFIENCAALTSQCDADCLHLIS